MTTPYESAQLILRLYELRREPLMRTARQWFVREFDPATIDDVKAVVASREHNPYMRMVVGYWDMACSLVVHGALDRQMFLDSATEIFGTFCKIQPLLPEIRQVSGPAFAKNIEAVLMAEPDILTRLEALRKRLRAVAAALAAPAAAPA